MSVDPIFWLLAAIGFVVLEAMTLNLVSIWFAVGSAAALLSCLVTGSFRVQAVVFVAVSTLCLLALKPLCDLVQTLKQGEKLLPREPVLLLDDGRSVAEGSTDDFGEVRLPGVVPAEYVIKVQRADGSVLAVRHSVPAQGEQRATLALMPK